MATGDEEQIEALQRWWKENGTSLIVGVALVLAGFFGWRQWQASQENAAIAAADIYQQIAQLVPRQAGAEVSGEDISTMAYLNEQLRSEFPKSIYARFAALQMARIYVEADDLAAAEAQLSWILDNPGLGLMQSSNDALYLTARSRLARVVLARGEPERALSLLAAVDPGEFAANYAEIEGDAHMALGDRDRARDAYQRALSEGSGNVLIDLKLSNLGI